MRQLLGGKGVQVRAGKTVSGIDSESYWSILLVSNARRVASNTLACNARLIIDGFRPVRNFLNLIPPLAL